MSRRYLRSNGSKHESKFFTCGKGLYGEENFITDLFKMVGKFNELSEFGKKNKLGVMYLAKTELLNMKIEDIQI